MSWKKWKGTALGAIAAPFTGGISLAGGFLYDSAKQQEEAVKKANAYDLYTWDLANQYNDPKAQMQRLAAAGLNPNLVYGSGSVTGNTTSTAHSNGVAPGVAGGILDRGLPLAQAGANLVNTWKNNQLLAHQVEKTDADRKWVEAQTTDLNNYLNGTGRTTRDFGRKIQDVWHSLFGDEPSKGNAGNSISGRLGKFIYDLFFGPLVDDLNGPKTQDPKNPRNRATPWNPGGWV